MPALLPDTPVVLPGSAALRFDPDGPFTITPILDTAAGLSAGPDGDTTALALAQERTTGAGAQRIVVIGDADFMSTATQRLRDPGVSSLPAGYQGSAGGS